MGTALFVIFMLVLAIAGAWDVSRCRHRRDRTPDDTQ